MENMPLYIFLHFQNLPYYFFGGCSPALPHHSFLFLLSSTFLCFSFTSYSLLSLSIPLPHHPSISTTQPPTIYPIFPHPLSLYPQHFTPHSLSCTSSLVSSITHLPSSTPHPSPYPLSLPVPIARPTTNPFPPHLHALSPTLPPSPALPVSRHKQECKLLTTQQISRLKNPLMPSLKIL